MGFTLALDASTYTGSVALFDGEALVGERTAPMRGEKEERLMPAVAELLREADVTARALERVVCGAGPGSFTSLRIAASIAKGLAFAGGARLEGVSSLALIAAAPGLEPGRYVATLDAMRGDRFAAAFQVERVGLVAIGDPWLAPHAEVAARAAALGAQLVGPGEATDRVPQARGVARLLGSPFIHPVDLARWEPLYGRLAEAQVRWEREHGRALESAHGRA
jgi:tRNA threonylcarbamoyladenosine biosynthesis protein TsaB